MHALLRGSRGAALLCAAMSRRPLALLFALSALLLALTVPATAQVQRIKPGISAAGVDLSGLTVPEAAARLDQLLAPRLQGPMVLGAAGRPWNLTVAEAKLKLDSTRTAKRALYAKAGVTTVPPAISHSRAAVRDFVTRVAAQVRKAPRNARIRITVRHIFREKSRVGRALPIDATRKAIDAQLDDPAAPRKVHARLTKVKPRVTFANLARVYNTVLTIDRPNFKLRLFKGLKFRKSYGIAVGMAGLETPAGRYAIQNKQVNPAWHVPNSAWAGSLAGQVIPGGAPNNPLKARWLGIADGVGIHGTAEDWSIGTRASHGCIRMHVSDVVDLFKRVPVGTAVLIR
jgi:lipoprotein-anchoring transpeptidase ErfK/SrfK